LLQEVQTVGPASMLLELIAVVAARMRAEEVDSFEKEELKVAGVHWK
jgi:hypothetical protein